VRLWHLIEVPKANPVVRAELRIAADNAFKVWLDGQELGSGSDWRTLSIYHLEGTLAPGEHTLAVEGFNDNDQAGVILGLRLEMASGQVLQIRSDQTWCVVPNADRRWETALRPAENWPHASLATNFGRIPWWSVPASVLHIRGPLPKPIPVWQSREFRVGLFAGCGVFVVICLYLLIQLVSQSKAHHLLQAERDRIARDIHDDLGSKLTQLLLAGEVAQIASTPAAAAPLSQMCDGARNILATIDEVVWIVNSQHDNLEDFAIYLCKFAQNFLESTPIRCRFGVAAEMPAKTLSQLMRRNLFLAIKEAVNNAAKHSEATELTVCIELTGARLRVVVADNGRGFDPAQASQDRNGLTNMRQRMAEIGGDCQVASRRGEGCQVTFQAPLKQNSFLNHLFRARPQHYFAARTPLGDKN
jgi:signal transduction histidine kinase